MKRIDKILARYREQFDRRCINVGERVGIYGAIIAAMGAEQFTWRGLPDDFLSHMTESAVNSGVAVAYEVPREIVGVNSGFQITPAVFTGVLKNDGTSDTVITRGTDYSLEINLKTDKAVIIKNNDFMYSEYPNLLWFADMLARTDESEKALIIWSKMHPIAKATSGIDAAKLEECLRDIINNDSLFNVISDDTKVVSGQPMSRDDGVLRLTDENAVEKMHFLSEFHYELIRRYCNLYNMPFRTTAKSAQNLDAELHNTDIFSQILNANRLKCRQDAAKKISEVFGVNCTVDYSEMIKKENDVIDANIEHEKQQTLTGKEITEEPKEKETEETTETTENESE